MILIWAAGLIGYAGRGHDDVDWHESSKWLI